MHGNKSQRQRESALARFQSGAVDTLVATDVAARGIDVEGVTHVINFDPPDDRDAYVHRVGRTGRAGRTGVAITLVDRHQEAEIASLADALELEHELNGSSRNGRRPRPRRRRVRAGSPQAPPAVTDTTARARHRAPASLATSRPRANQRRRRSRQSRRRRGTQPTG